MHIVKVFDINDMTANFSHENGTNEWALSPDLPNWVSLFQYYSYFNLCTNVILILQFLSLLFFVGITK